MMNNYFNGVPYPYTNIPYSGLNNAANLSRGTGIGLGNLFRSSPSLLGGIASRSAPLASAATAGSKITFSGILNGASKTLGVINQAIPVFYQVKPIWNNAKTMFRVAKAINNNNNNEQSTTTQSTTKQNSTTDNPSFFI